MLDKDKNLKEDVETAEHQGNKGGQSEAEATEEVTPSEEYSEDSDQL